MIYADANTSWSFDMSQFDQVWYVALQICLLLAALLVANMFRRMIPFLRKAFIPSALIGGFLLLIINIILKACNVQFWGHDFIDQRIMQIITYHALAIGFIASSLKIVDKDKRVPFIKSVQNGAITGGTYMLQAVFGIAVSLIFFAILGGKFFYDAGILLPLGFGQGPGNALTWDINFSNIADNYFDGQGSVGLTIASIGFLVASIVGVAYMNIFRWKKQIVHKEKALTRKVEDFELQNEIEDSESVDKLSIQIAFVALCYGISFLIMLFFKKVSDWTNVKLFNDVAWGFNFIWGVISATIVTLIIKFCMKKKIIHRRYINNYQMDRISGFAFDVMIIAGVSAIDIKAVGNYIWFIIALCAVGAIVTLFYVRIMTKLCFKDYQHEAFLVNFGTLTGTASNGMIFLREVDPNNETPMSNIFIVSQLPAMIFVAPLLLLLKMSGDTFVKCLIAMGVFLLLFLVYTTFLILTGLGVFKRKKKIAEAEVVDVESKDVKE